MARRLLVAALLVAFAFAVSGCEIEYFDKEKKNLKKACPTAPAAMPTHPALPGNFPDAEGVVYTGVERAGPSTIASGYMAQTIGPSHDAYSAALKSAAGYSITKEEQDAADAEVNFSGNGKSGQVKLLQVCKARTKVTITIRPA
jgi:hypothetical protein